MRGIFTRSYCPHFCVHTAEFSTKTLVLHVQCLILISGIRFMIYRLLSNGKKYIFPKTIRWLTDLSHPLIETLVSNLAMCWFWCIMNLCIFWWLLSVDFARLNTLCVVCCTQCNDTFMNSTFAPAFKICSVISCALGSVSDLIFCLSLQKDKNYPWGHKHHNYKSKNKINK